LKDAGILSEDEFNAKKADLLAKIWYNNRYIAKSL
jgi:hypothetical protein